MKRYTKGLFLLVPGLILVTVCLLMPGRPALIGQDSQAGGKRSPNVLLVSIDYLRADHLHCYGYRQDTSPVIDSVAAEGVRFETCVAPSSWTLPSHVTLLTALPPECHGVVGESWALHEDAVCLAEVLNEKGYETAAFVSGPLLQARYGYGQGFDLYDDFSVETAGASADDSHEGVSSPDLHRLARDWLGEWEERRRPGPFFLFLHMWDVHFDYAPPPPFDTMFDPDYEGDITATRYPGNKRINPDMDPRDLEHVLALYDGEIRYTDQYIGKILGELKARRIYDQTIVVITSDHGDEFFEHGKKGHRNNLFDETLLVPLLIRFPGMIPAGTVVAGQVRLMDVAPTILDLAGIDSPEAFGMPRPKGPHHERSLLPFVLGEPAGPERDLLAFSDLHMETFSVRTEDTKLIIDPREEPKKMRFDLIADPMETENLFGRDRNLDARLWSELRGFRNHSRTSRFREASELPEYHMDHLRTLGYFQ